MEKGDGRGKREEEGEEIERRMRGRERREGEEKGGNSGGSCKILKKISQKNYKL